MKPRIYLRWMLNVDVFIAFQTDWGRTQILKYDPNLITQKVFFPCPVSGRKLTVT